MSKKVLPQPQQQVPEELMTESALFEKFSKYGDKVEDAFDMDDDDSEWKRRAPMYQRMSNSMATNKEKLIKLDEIKKLEDKVKEDDEVSTKSDHSAVEFKTKTENEKEFIILDGDASEHDQELRVEINLEHQQEQPMSDN